MRYIGLTALIIIGTSGASALTHFLPKLKNTLLKYKWTELDEKFFHGSWENNWT